MKNAPRQRIFLHSTADCCFFHWQQGPAAMSSSSSPQSTSNWTCIAVAAAMKYLASTSSLLAHPSAFQSRRSEGYISPDCTLPLSSSSSSSSPFPPQNSTHTHTHTHKQRSLYYLSFSQILSYSTLSLLTRYLSIPSSLLHSLHPCTHLLFLPFPVLHFSTPEFPAHLSIFANSWFIWNLRKGSYFLNASDAVKTSPPLVSFPERSQTGVEQRARSALSTNNRHTEERQRDEVPQPPTPAPCVPKVLQVLYALPCGLIALSSIRVLRKFHSCFFFFFLGFFFDP